MCDPCFMDANQVGFVHELSWEDVKEILDNALKIKPRRQMSVQFSGGEPTMSPYFIDGIRYARKLGYNSVQAATNGIEFAKSKEFCRRAFEAGLRYRSEEHTSELQSRLHLVCRLLLEKKNTIRHVVVDDDQRRAVVQHEHVLDRHTGQRDHGLAVASTSFGAAMFIRSASSVLATVPPL